MNKDFKKLALLGMAGGLLLSSQAAQANDQGANVDYGNYLAGHGCGNGCHSRPQPNNDTNYYPQGQVYQPQSYSSHGCGNRGGSSNTVQGTDRYQIQSGADYSNVPYYDPNNIVAEGPAAPVVEKNQPKLTEADLLKQLNAQGKATYQTLSTEGKALALKLANQTCKGQNDCKGLNSCKTDDHDCAGKGGCKGTGKGPFTDKNAAVKVAAQKMAEKRNNTLNKTKNSK